MTYVRKEVLADGVERDWVTIYALCQPIDRWKTGAVRYVGKTRGVVWHRVRSHIYAAKRQGAKLPVLRWLKKHIDAQDPLHIIHLERVPLGQDWAARERYWIQKYRSEGAPLLNLTNGGEGLHGHKFTAEHRSRIAAALRTGMQCACEVCGATFWRKLREVKLGNNRFCSRACYQSWQIGKPKGKSHGS